MAGARSRGKWADIVKRIGKLPGQLLHTLTDKMNTLLYSAQQAPTAQDMPLAAESIRRLETIWKSVLSKSKPEPPPILSPQEKDVVERIRRSIQCDNRNNVTRTAAYWSMYRKYPELHWAFLAHMVSRNGGWSMTDLKGELLPRLLNAKLTEHLFQFLERANGLIFQDAYPQLLLYEESRKAGRNLFHLLPQFGVSSFMGPVWDDFRIHGDSVMLTICLIINEQHYIEKRIVQNPYYRKHVLDTLEFKTQAVMQLNQVVFPYWHRGSSATIAEHLPAGDGAGVHSSGERPRLAGLILEDFGDKKERIEFGKKLYAILFGLPDVFRGAQEFAVQTPHSGSRADYWPGLFASIRKAPPEPKFKERLEGCKLKAGASPLYSPRLEQAWKDRALAPAEPGDWFHDLTAMEHIRPITVPFLFDMTSESCFGLNKIELAILAGEQLK